MSPIFYGCIFSYVLRGYQGAALQCYMAHVCSVLEKTARLVHHYRFPLAVYLDFNFPISSLRPVTTFLNQPPNGCELVPLRGFNLHLPNDLITSSAFSCTSFFGGMSLQKICPFKNLSSGSSCRGSAVNRSD